MHWLLIVIYTTMPVSERTWVVPNKESCERYKAQIEAQYEGLTPKPEVLCKQVWKGQGA